MFIEILFNSFDYYLCLCFVCAFVGLWGFGRQKLHKIDLLSNERLSERKLAEVNGGKMRCRRCQNYGDDNALRYRLVVNVNYKNMHYALRHMQIKEVH